MDDLWERFHIEVDKGQTPVRIDKYLTEHMAGTSRNRIQAAADNEHITVNGTPVRSNYKVKPLDDIRILLDHEPIDTTITPENIPLTVVYEDDDLMVINKFAPGTAPTSIRFCTHSLTISGRKTHRLTSTTPT